MSEGKRLIADRQRSLAVASAIRKRIVAGEFARGSQLPTWDRLGEEYSVARNTLVRAISHLKQHGYIYASSTRGTYVVDRPPHLHNYALLFHDAPGTGDWNQFWWSLSNRAAEIQEQRGCTITVKYGVRDEYNNEAHRRLLEEVACDQYAGLIFVGKPDHMSPQCVDMSELPKVVIQEKSDRATLPKVDIDRQSFTTKALDWVQARGYTKVAVLSSYGSTILDTLRKGVAERGMEFRPHWFLSSSFADPMCAEAIVRLLLCCAQPELPDVLIVANDNLVDAAMAGVVASGKRVPDDLQVLTPCNWPTPRGHVIPTVRLGYDVRQVLREALGLIDQWRAGTEVASCIAVPALFEDEVSDRLPPA